MISPTQRAIWLMAAGVPLMLLVALAAPAYWTWSAGWIAGVGALILLDAMLGARLGAYACDVATPSLLYIDGEDPAEATFYFAKGPLPQRIEVQLETNDLVERIPPRGLRGFEGRTRQYDFRLRPARRGAAKLTNLWARWTGPLGLARKQRRTRLDIEIPIVPNIRWVKEEAVRLYARDSDFGVKAQIERGDGSEFDALREFSTGMDRRAIDWKHSARHRALLAKEFKTERNHSIVFAFDTGRLMSEPLDGVPKIDRAINSALLLAYVSLRSGDRTALFGFDARPRLSSHVLHGTAAFPHQQKLAAQLDYSAEEANYTLALTDLSSRLERRALVILFTDFVDTISAELMLETVKRLTDKHVVLFAAFRDEALERLIDAAPAEPEDVARAVMADTLLQEREIVFRKLRRMGVQIIESRPEDFGAQLVSRYLDIKRRELL